MPDAVKLGIACGAANTLNYASGVIDPQIAYGLVESVEGTEVEGGLEG
jgi:hypothetical protein